MEALSPQDKLLACLRRRPADARAVHGLSLKLGFLCSTFLCNNLLQAYSSRAMVGDAGKLFDEIYQPNAVTWSTMISCHARVGDLGHAVELLKTVLRSNAPCREGEDSVRLNTFTLGSIITGCAHVKDLDVGLQMHCGAIKFGFEHDAFVAGTLINMYGKLEELSEAWRVFEEARNKGTVAWTTMVTCLANSRDFKLQNAAFQVFKDMICRGIQPVGKTFVSVVKVFADPGRLRQAKQVHGCLVKHGVEVDDLLGSALIAAYGRCGGLDEAFRLSGRVNMDVVSWTALLVACMQNGFNIEAINVFGKMLKENVIVDAFVLTSAIGACSKLAEFRTGEEIHCYSLRNNLLTDVSVGNALVTLYGKCNQITKAERVFELSANKDIISWTALLTCYVQNGCAVKGILLFQCMLREEISPSIYCMSSVICACSTLANLAVGQQIHLRSVKMGMDDNVSVQNSLITMYAKCGEIEVAWVIFNSMTKRDTVSWNAIITGCSHCSHEREALELFRQMWEGGIQPDDYTFTGVLVSCSRLGLIADGCNYFKIMSAEYGIKPKIEHYACIVDLFGRYGSINDAMEFINGMPCEPDQLVWEALLAACKLHGHVELGKAVAEKILEIGLQLPSPYITLSNMYAAIGMWDSKASVQALMKDVRVVKDPGRSWIEGCNSQEHAVSALQSGGA